MIVLVNQHWISTSNYKTTVSYADYSYWYIWCISFYHITNVTNHLNGSFLPSLLRIQRINPDTWDQIQSLTQNGNKVSTLRTQHPWAPAALPRWNRRKRNCHQNQTILSSFPLPNLNSLSPELREKLPLKVCTLILSTIKRTQQTQTRQTTNALHYIHLVKSFFPLFYPEHP